MKLTTKKNGIQLTVFLSGELNSVSAPELSALLDREMAGMQTLVLDFTECDYISSAGLRVLLGTYKQVTSAGGTMQLANVGENFMDVLKNTGLAAVFGM